MIALRQEKDLEIAKLTETVSQVSMLLEHSQDGVEQQLGERRAQLG